MRTSARVVIVGGGVSGLSALYHLTQEGWTDLVLLERNELTSGTTWHSAAQCPQLAFNQLLLLLRKYTIQLYKELADDPDYPINYHHRTGGMRLITDQDNLDASHHIISVAKGLGINFDLLDPAEAVRRNPLVQDHGLMGALWDDLDGDIDPAQLCQALARRARKAGAEITRNCPVTGLTQKPDNEWIIHTDKGDIEAEHVVIAAGYRANEVGEMLDIKYPVISMEHMYFVTEDIPELLDRPDRVPMVRCPRDTFYMRQEKKGLLVGIYEMDCKTFGMDGIDPDFVNALCPDDLDRLLPKMDPIFERLPCLQEVGIKSVVNGPIAYAADAGPLVGKQPGRRNLWSMNGIRVGIGEGGGYGKMLAQMMVHGETEWDTWQLDPRRITSFANTEYTALKAIEDYQMEFQWHMPHEHRPAGRPAKTTPLYPVLQAQGAAFGVVNGWERTSFYKPRPDFVEEYSYKFCNWHDVVAAEVKAVQTRVGIAELSGFNRFEITGTDAAAWIDSLTCTKLPKAKGRVGLCYFLSDNGNIDAEATVTKFSDNHLWYCSAAAAEYHDMDWLTERLPAGSDIQITSLTNSHTVLIIAGPHARALLDAACARPSFAQHDFPWMTARTCFVGHVEATIMAVSFSGEQAFEVHIPNIQLHAAYFALTKAGEAFGLTHFGMYAIESMRMEKGYGHWKGDFITEFNPFEAGVERFVDLSKDFPGKVGLERQIALGNRRKRVLIEIDSKSAPAHAGETVFDGTIPVGTITSAAWGHRTEKNLAIAYVDPRHSGVGTDLSVMLIGQRVGATIAESCIYDTAHAIPRGQRE
ncbi:GcvT family protein [Ruegeria arenilitoris]|uniref:GcvT family protein n=1 Tax=Ruegeria arenilitoris TaxID=1173585 RepID=UPI001481CD49|nr:FAD-dependent oxidoreductase [Ruegeria arenilitoris]